MYLNDPKTSWRFDDCVSCMSFEGPEFAEFQKGCTVFCIIRHRPYFPDAKKCVDFDKKTLEVLFWWNSEDVIQTTSKQPPGL